jgi:hypothetical protein
VLNAAQLGKRGQHRDADLVRCTTGQGEKIFGGKDVRKDPPAELAVKLIERLPNVAALGFGEDPEYRKWYSEILQATEPAGLIHA